MSLAQSRRAARKFGNFLEKIRMDVEEEAEPRGKVVDREATARDTLQRKPRPSAKVKPRSWAAVAPASRM